MRNLDKMSREELIEIIALQDRSEYADKHVIDNLNQAASHLLAACLSLFGYCESTVYANNMHDQEDRKIAQLENKYECRREN